MKSGRAKIGIFQKMRIKNLRGVSEVRFKKNDSFTLETSKNHLIRNFLRNGRLRVKNLIVVFFVSSLTILKLRNERNSTGYWLGFKKSEGPCEIVDVNGNCATVAKFDHPNLTQKSKKLDFLGKI